MALGKCSWPVHLQLIRTAYDRGVHVEFPGFRPYSISGSDLWTRQRMAAFELFAHFGCHGDSASALYARTVRTRMRSDRRCPLCRASVGSYFEPYCESRHNAADYSPSWPNAGYFMPPRRPLLGIVGRPRVLRRTRRTLLRVSLASADVTRSLARAGLTPRRCYSAMHAL